MNKLAQSRGIFAIFLLILMFGANQGSHVPQSDRL
jgi:hypothetical protein